MHFGAENLAKIPKAGDFADNLCGLAIAIPSCGMSGRRAALLILDMLNDFDFPEASQLLPEAKRVAKRLRNLKKRARRAGLPTIYVNDNYGDWRAGIQDVYARALHGPGREIAELLEPEAEDYFVIKPKHSGFFETPLHQMLMALQVEDLILTGIAGNICVLFTAHDAYMRGYRIIVPSDAIASNTAGANEAALRQLRAAVHARTPKSAGLPAALKPSPSRSTRRSATGKWPASEMRIA